MPAVIAVRRVRTIAETVQTALPPLGGAARRLVLAACLMATFMAAAEATVVATAMPSIVAELGGFSLYSWAFSAFLITQAVSIPLYGRLADIHGRKAVFYAGTVLFLAGSILCGLAPSMPWLVAFRAIQGLGAGGVQPIVMTICGDMYTPAERARVQGLISGVFGVAAVTGPSLGAALVQYGAWPLVFWLSVPIGLVSLAMVAAFLREQVVQRPHQIDYAGSLLLTLATTSLLLAVVEGGALPGWGAAVSWVTAAGAGAMLIRHEARTAEPMLPLELWRNRVISVGSLGSFLNSAVMIGVAAFLPAYVQGPMGGSPGLAGLVLGVMSVTWALASAMSGPLLLRMGYRAAAVAGTFCLAAGCLLLVGLTPARGPLWAGAGSLVIGVGMGLCNTAFIVSIQAAVPWAQRGAATSSVMFARFLGQILGVALAGAVLNWAVLERGVGGASIDALVNPALRPSLPEAELAALSEAVAAGLHNGYWAMLALSAISVLLVTRMPSGSTRA